MKISPFLSSPRNTSIPNQRQGVNFETNIISEPLLNTMQRYLKDGGATVEQLEQIEVELAKLRQIRPDLPARAFASTPQEPTTISIGLGVRYKYDLYFDIISPLIERALKTVGYHKEPHKIDSTIIQGIFDESGQIGVFANIPHDNPEEAIQILQSLHEIAKIVPRANTKKALKSNWSHKVTSFLRQFLNHKSPTA